MVKPESNINSNLLELWNYLYPAIMKQKVHEKYKL